MEDDDRFYRFDEFGRPLDPDSIARREVLRKLRNMSDAELFEYLVSRGFLNPDGTLPEPYRDNGEPSKYRPTD